MELLKFLREESEANRKAQREDAEVNRDLLAKIVRYAAGAISVIVAAAGLFFFSDIHKFKEALEAEAKDATKAQIKKMDEEAAANLRAEMGKIDTQIDDTLNLKSVREIMHKAAVDAAHTEARPLIESGVRSQVREEVSHQSGMIRRIAEQAVSSEVQETIKPLAKGASETVAQLHTQELIARANADDAQAFDELRQLKDTASDSQRTLINSVIADRVNRTLERFRAEQANPMPCATAVPALYTEAGPAGPAGIATRTIASCMALMEQMFDLRWDTVGVLEREAQATPVVVSCALDCRSLDARLAAISFVNLAFSRSPGFRYVGDLDTGTLRAWWKENQSNYRALELYAWTRWLQGRDSAALYHELERSLATSPPSLKDAIGEALHDMRELAKLGQDTPAELSRKLGRDTCTDVQKDFAIRKLDDSDSYSFLAGC
jgi:hypothetical protein